MIKTLFGLLLALPALSLAAPINTPEMLAKGKAVYIVNCLSCHGEKGNGLGPAGKYMNPKPRNLVTDKFKNGQTAPDIFKSITKGLDGTGMSGFETLPESDRWALVYYVQSLQGGSKPTKTSEH